MTSTLEEIRIDASTREYGWDFEFRGYRAIKAAPPDVFAALIAVNDAMVPVTPDVVKAELARLRVTTKSRNGDGDDLRITMAAYAENLLEYPADVVIDALRSWAAMEKWWPAWSELKELLERRVRKRRALQNALAAAHDGKPWL